MLLLWVGQACGQSAAETPEVTQPFDDPAAVAQFVALLEATEWFDRIGVSVERGIVVLDGQTTEQRYRNWAEQVARDTLGTADVDNRITVSASGWDLTPTRARFRELTADTQRLLPSLLTAVLLLIASWLAGRWSMRAAALLLQRRVRSRLLRDVLARAAALPVFVLGLYALLRVLGLTGLAATVIGGTGLIGIVIGFACRDIAENFLASILISMQRPFASGDLIQVNEYHGYVQSVNTRSTLLMTLEGNHVQIPNATIYKNTITNFTANPKARFDFVVGIGYDDSIQKAQATALQIVKRHPAVVDDPEPSVLVEKLGAATVNLRVYFWIDIANYSHLKTRSSIIRLTKAAFEAAGISMPDEAREVVFPAGVPVQLVEQEARRLETPRPAVEADDSVESLVEDDYASEAQEIEKQASRSRSPEGGENLLAD